MIVGGLPEAVANYAKYKDWVRLNDIFNSLIAGYKDDIEKYAKKNKEQDILRYILNYGWGLAADNAFSLPNSQVLPTSRPRWGMPLGFWRKRFYWNLFIL